MNKWTYGKYLAGKNKDKYALFKNGKRIYGSVIASLEDVKEIIQNANLAEQIKKDLLTPKEIEAKISNATIHGSWKESASIAAGQKAVDNE